MYVYLRIKTFSFESENKKKLLKYLSNKNKILLSWKHVLYM